MGECQRLKKSRITQKLSVICLLIVLYKLKRKNLLKNKKKISKKFNNKKSINNYNKSKLKLERCVSILDLKQLKKNFHKL
jgi:hypothetical protein